MEKREGNEAACSPTERTLTFLPDLLEEIELVEGNAVRREKEGDAPLFRGSDASSGKHVSSVFEVGCGLLEGLQGQLQNLQQISHRMSIHSRGEMRAANCETSRRVRLE